MARACVGEAVNPDNRTNPDVLGSAQSVFHFELSGTNKEAIKVDKNLPTNLRSVRRRVAALGRYLEKNPHERPDFPLGSTEHTETSITLEAGGTSGVINLHDLGVGPDQPERRVEFSIGTDWRDPSLALSVFMTDGTAQTAKEMAAYAFDALLSLPERIPLPDNRVVVVQQPVLSQ